MTKQHRHWPQFAILFFFLLVGIVIQALAALGIPDIRRQILWSSVTYGALQCPVSLLGLWFGLRVASWRSAVAIALLIICYCETMNAVPSFINATVWQSYFANGAPHFWCQICAPILLIAVTVNHRRRCIWQFAIRDMVALITSFALVVAIANLLTIPDTMFFLIRGLLTYAITLVAAFMALSSHVNIWIRLIVPMITFPLAAVPPLVLGWHTMWVMRFPLDAAWLAVFLIGALRLLKRLENSNKGVSVAFVECAPSAS